jgi:hypothetical protein
MRGDGVEKSKRDVAVTVVIAGLDGDREFERTAAPRVDVRDSLRANGQHSENGG